MSFQHRESPMMTHSLMCNESILKRYLCVNTEQLWRPVYVKIISGCFVTSQLIAWDWFLFVIICSASSSGWEKLYSLYVGLILQYIILLI